MYKKQVIIIILLMFFPVTWLIISLIMDMGSASRIIAFLPGNDWFAQMAWIFIAIMIITSLSGIVGGFILAPIFLILHKLLYHRRGLMYGIQERPTPEKFTGTFKGLFPSIMAINFALMFAANQDVQTIILDPTFPSHDIVGTLITLVGLVIITSGIATFLFSPVWFLLDSGITYTNKNQSETTPDPIEIKSIGGLFDDIMKGYAGIGVIISYIGFISTLLPTFFAPGDVDMGTFGSLGLILAFPLLICLYALPGIIFLDIIRKQRRNYVLRIAKRIGIAEIIEV